MASCRICRLLCSVKLAMICLKFESKILLMDHVAAILRPLTSLLGHPEP